MFGQMINSITGSLWNVFLPAMIILGCYINFFIIRRGRLKKAEGETWRFNRIKNALTISLSSKVGTGAIIGVLAAMWKTSEGGTGGEGIVLWVMVGMSILVPLTYSEVLLSQMTKKSPKEFISSFFSRKMACVYTFGLIVLYSFGFVGFQFMGIQNVVKIFSNDLLNQSMGKDHILKFVIIPILIVTAIIVLTKSYRIFINSLGSMITLVIGSYIVLFLVFLFRTGTYIPTFIGNVFQDFMSFRTAGIGIPIGLIIGFQRIIQISETGLGTSAMASSDRKNSPHREALIQSISTVMAIFIAVVITSYIFSYGRENIQGVVLSPNGSVRLDGYFRTVLQICGYYGGVVLLVFFILSGMTTILGSFHFINMTLKGGEGKKIVIYLSLITLSAFMSISNFDVIFDISDLLMFIVASINIFAIFKFILIQNKQNKQNQKEKQDKIAVLGGRK